MVNFSMVSISKRYLMYKIVIATSDLVLQDWATACGTHEGYAVQYLGCYQGDCGPNANPQKAAGFHGICRYLPRSSINTPSTAIAIFLVPSSLWINLEVLVYRLGEKRDGFCQDFGVGWNGRELYVFLIVSVKTWNTILHRNHMIKCVRFYTITCATFEV